MKPTLEELQEAISFVEQDMKNFRGDDRVFRLIAHTKIFALQQAIDIAKGDSVIVPRDCKKADNCTGAFDGYKGDLNDAYFNVQNYINWASQKKEE